MKINFLDWLNEADEPTAAQAPTTDPNFPPQGQPTGGEMQQMPNEQMPADNVEDDPAVPDKDEQDSPTKDFEQWRYEFFELSMSGDVAEMLDSIEQVRDLEGLDSAQRKFVEDNLQILLYRQDANVAQATKEIRNLIKQDLDRTNPGTTLMQHLTTVLEKDPVLSQVLLKLSGFYGMKADLHRKYVAAILGAVQVGSGASKPDLMYFDKDYTINISTRFASQFGEINLGKWSLKSDDPQRYLTEPELDRLNEGSPEEKQTLRRRIILESIAAKFKQRAFLIHIADSSGSVFNFGWDLGDSLLAAYKDGKVVVRGKQNEEKDAMISDTGEIITLIDLDILYIQESGETNDDGKPEMLEVPFIERRDSNLYVNGTFETLQAASSSLSGMFFRESPYNGNPGEVLTISRCIPSLSELVGRRCSS